MSDWLLPLRPRKRRTNVRCGREKLLRFGLPIARGAHPLVPLALSRAKLPLHPGAGVACERRGGSGRDDRVVQLFGLPVGCPASSGTADVSAPRPGARRKYGSWWSRGACSASRRSSRQRQRLGAVRYRRRGRRRSTKQPLPPPLAAPPRRPQPRRLTTTPSRRCWHASLLPTRLRPWVRCAARQSRVLQARAARAKAQRRRNKLW